MNFDDDDDTDFNIVSQSGNKLASLFQMNNDNSANESLKYKAPKQPTAPAHASSTSSSSGQSPVLFFTNVQAFKYQNDRYESQGKLGLAILASQNTYKLLLYATKTQPTAIIKLSSGFKIALQKNNYSSFYDEQRQLWSVLFDSEELVAAFATHIALCKTNLLLQLNESPVHLRQDLRFNDSDTGLTVEATDSIEIETLATLHRDFKLADVVENTQQNATKLRLGKNKLPKQIEDLLVDMKQGDRKLFVLSGKHFLPLYANTINANSILFYDIKILRIKKNERKERSTSNASMIEQMPLPQLSPASLHSDDARSRSDSIKDKARLISDLNDQLNDSKLDKAKLISRIAKMGQPMLQRNVSPGLLPNENEAQFGMNDSTQQMSQFLLQQQQQQHQMAFQNQLLQQQQMAFQNQLLPQSASK